MSLPKPPTENYRRYATFFATCCVIVTVASLFAVHAGGYLAAVGLSWIVFLCGSAVGIFFGFLFSVPRIVVGDAENNEILEEGVGNGKVSMQGQRLLQSNSNLERISDWLTTMIVGVTLINFSDIISFFHSFNGYLALSAQVFTASEAQSAGALPIVGTMLLVTGLVFGFLGMYLGTRIYLTAMLLEAEKTLARPEVLPEAAGEVVIANMQNLPEMTKAFEAAAASRQVYPREAVQTMNKLLYQRDGYQKVIEMSATLISTSARELPEFWFFLSAAFGQKYTWLLKNGGEKADIESAKDNAIDAARRAVELDPTYRRELLRISKSDGPDDDLAALREDPSFRRIVQLS